MNKHSCIEKTYLCPGKPGDGSFERGKNLLRQRGPWPPGWHGRRLRDLLEVFVLGISCSRHLCLMLPLLHRRVCSKGLHALPLHFDCCTESVTSAAASQGKAAQGFARIAFAYDCSTAGRVHVNQSWLPAFSNKRKQYHKREHSAVNSRYGVQSKALDPLGCSQSNHRWATSKEMLSKAELVALWTSPERSISETLNPSFELLWRWPSSPLALQFSSKFGAHQWDLH